MNPPPLSLYVGVDSPIHRLAAGLKLGLLTVFVIGCATISSPWVAATACGGMLAVLQWARIPLRLVWQQTRAFIPFLLFIAVALYWQDDARTAGSTVLRLAASALAAVAFTLTTRLSAMQDAVASALRPFEKWGFPASRVAMALALTIRLIPLVFAMTHEVLEARRARGLSWSLRAFGVPIMIRCLRRAIHIGEALQARGLD